jgi:MerR family transcriptional regulator, light-induced transcriptional regulator
MATAPETLLRTQQLARALGVSVSTIKRWVDAGALKATRTVGWHRLIPIGEALRFAREQGLVYGDLELLAGPGCAPVGGVAGRMCDALATALRRGRGSEARSLIASAYVSAGGAVELGDGLIRPALERVGHEWEVGSLDVYQEHRASRIVEGALLDLIHRSPEPAPSAPLALGATPEGDRYTLSGLLCELTLRELGWEATNLGAGLPMGSLATAVRVHRPRLVWLSVHRLEDEERFLQEYANFYASASATGAAVVLGGPALGPGLRARLVAASFGDRLAHLAEFARRLGSGADGSSPRGGPPAPRGRSD